MLITSAIFVSTSVTERIAAPLASDILLVANDMFHYSVFRSKSSRNKLSWVEISVLSIFGCMTLGKLFIFS